MDCPPPVQREKAIHSVGDRPNPREEANSDPPPKPVLDNDERWLGRSNNYGRSRSPAGQDRTASENLLLFLAWAEPSGTFGFSSSQRRNPHLVVQHRYPLL